ncbi:MAG: hypothetical protein ACOVQA_13395 [Thermoflexibacteraceae bacterium]
MLTQHTHINIDLQNIMLLRTLNFIFSLLIIGSAVYMFYHGTHTVIAILNFLLGIILFISNFVPKPKKV